jgi:hypothetical protein
MRRPRLGAVFGGGLRVVAAILLVVSLFEVWWMPYGYFFVLDFRGDLGFNLDLGIPDAATKDGWERWHALDIALAALAAGLLVVTAAPRRALAAVLMLVSLAAAACVALAGFNSPGVLSSPGDPSTVATAESHAPGPGPYLALGALLAIVALAPLLRRPRAPTL